MGDPKRVYLLYNVKYDTLVEYRQYDLSEAYGYLAFCEEGLLPSLYNDEMLCLGLYYLIRNFQYENLGVLYEQVSASK
jgi:hypothetical protein